MPKTRNYLFVFTITAQRGRESTREETAADSYILRVDDAPNLKAARIKLQEYLWRHVVGITLFSRYEGWYNHKISNGVDVLDESVLIVADSIRALEG